MYIKSILQMDEKICKTDFRICPTKFHRRTSQTERKMVWICEFWVQNNTEILNPANGVVWPQKVFQHTLVALNFVHKPFLAVFEGLFSIYESNDWLKFQC